ncbi:MAG TPA: sugar phosphate nucleotidyltransferase [Anaerolineae bacterium]|nr:sugar phosphate nucleotidyltransferase [Anaerolineae bacterium]HQH38849.1 sugar phosphate nucleotidyltransferase [Anaerolineae bacterium]
MSEQIPVIILCGGKGTRMGDRTVPKPLVEVGERPILWHVMKIYAAQGFTDFILALGYQGDLIKRYFLEYDWQSRDFTLVLGDGVPLFHTPNDTAGWRITFAETGLETMTGARVRKAARYVQTPRFFVTYADGVADIDLHALLTYHERQGLLATMTGVRASSRFGVLETTAEGKVTGFKEKPLVETLINGGFLVFERAALRYLEGGDDLVLEHEPFHALATAGQLAVYEHHGFWRAMDTFKEAQELTALWEEGAPWKIW